MSVCLSQGGKEAVSVIANRHQLVITSLIVLHTEHTRKPAGFALRFSLLAKWFFFPQILPGKPKVYQGVRVKITVKELLQQRRARQAATGSAVSKNIVVFALYLLLEIFWVYFCQDCNLWARI